MHVFWLLLTSALCALICCGEVSSQHNGDLPPTTGTTIDTQVPAVAQENRDCVVRVLYGDGESVTGTVITDEGLVLTCAHFLSGVTGDIEVCFSDNRRMKATVLSKLPTDGERRQGKDIALLKLQEPGKSKPVRLAKSSHAPKGSPLIALGFPDTTLLGLSREQIPSYLRVGVEIDGFGDPIPNELRTTIHGYGGDSGGPLFNLSGNLIGITQGGDASGAHVSYTRVEVLDENWEKLAKGFKKPEFAASTVEATAPSSAIQNAARFRSSVVEVCSNSYWVGIGCIVGDGLVLTKGSILGPNLTVRTGDDFVGIATVKAFDSKLDLALLELPYAPEIIKQQFAINWHIKSELDQGASVALSTPPFAEIVAGVVCCAPQSIPRSAGFIPCEFSEATGGVTVKRISEEMRAFRMRKLALPLIVGDVLTEVEGQSITGIEQYRKLMFASDQIGQRIPVSGEPLSIKFRRGDQEREATVVLEFANTPSGQLVRPVSNRYSGYPKAIVTNLDARPEHCGGPVFDAQGRAVGILIAKAPLIESLVLPASEVSAGLAKLMAVASE